MDDPMIRSRLGRINGTRPLGALDPKREPLFFCSHFASIAYSWTGLATGSVEMLRFAQRDNRSPACSTERGLTAIFLGETIRNFRRGGALGFSIGAERVRRRFRGGAMRRSQT